MGYRWWPGDIGVKEVGLAVDLEDRMIIDNDERMHSIEIVLIVFAILREAERVCEYLPTKYLPVLGSLIPSTHTCDANNV